VSLGFLSRDDLRQLTGAARQSGQCDWLRSEGIPFKLSRKDELLVTWKHVHLWIEGRHAPLSYAEPDFSSLGG
jgi:hypothetical protein